MSWFSKPKKQQFFDVPCRIQVISGYAKWQSGILDGRLTAIKNEFFFITMPVIYVSGLSVFDHENSLSLSFTDKLSVCVKADSYQRREQLDYSVIVRFAPTPQCTETDMGTLIEKIAAIVAS